MFGGCLTGFLLLVGTIGAFLGSIWTLNFGFTEYRSHLAHIGLPLGLITLVVSLAFIYFGVSRVRRTPSGDDETP